MPFLLPFCCPFCFLARPCCRPFCCLAASVLPPFLLSSYCFTAAVLPPSFYCFPSPLSPSSCSPRPATFCELLPAPMVTFCELLPVPMVTFCELFANFCPRPLWQSWHFVNFWRHFAHPCQPAVNFLPTFARARFGKVGILSTFGDTLRTCGAPFVTFCYHFCRISVFFANFNFTSAGL